MILVTGGTGFVGPKVVHALRAENRPVRALVRNPSSAPARQLEAWGCEVVPGDMTDVASVKRAVEGCDTVVHLVAIAKGSAELFERLMAQGTRDLVAAAKDAGVTRFVLMSALGTGPKSKDLTPYFKAKWDQEETVKAAGIDHTIFRPSFIFGRDGGTLAILIRQVRWSPVVAIVGTRRFQPIWVDDVASYFAKSLSVDEARNKTFEIAGPDVVAWEDVYDRIKRCLGTRRPTFHLPMGVARAGAFVVEKLPTDFPMSRDALTMMEFADNVTDIRPAVETLGVEPIGVEEQIRRAAA